VGQLAGGVAHDFNNLLSVILTCAGFAQREAPEGTPLRDDVDEIKRAAERAGELVRRLLAFGRKEVVQPRVIDLARAVSDLEGLMRRSLTERVQLELDLDEGAPRVLMDPVRFEQLLVNLVLNARDALSERGGRVTVSIGATESGAARVCVADDGPGMSAEVARRAFEPFFTTKSAGEGTGLGLATVESIVADAGGTVLMTSEPGAGTTVTIDLPVTAEPVAGATPDAPAELPANGRKAQGCVLVVEDQAPVRRQARRILEAYGYRVVEAGDGAEALERLDGVDLLLTDVVMPGMSGRELARAAVRRREGLRVVYMSGHTEDALVHAGVRGGDVGYVPKPFSDSALLHAVAVALAPEPIG
jgi:CheY-like chemotaxis protein/two-component sensor histidine kinase